MPDAPTKQQLLENLRATGDEVVSRVRPLDDAALAAGRYENGWNARQILAHVASIEWTYSRLIDMAKSRRAPSAPAASPAATPSEWSSPTPRSAADPNQPPPGSPILSYNDRQVAKRAGASKDELLAEFEKNRAALIAAVEQADDALFSVELRSAGGIEGPLSLVLQFVAVEHVRQHLRDIMGGA